MRPDNLGDEMKIRDIEITVNFIQVSCPKCGSTWGVQVKTGDIADIPIPKLLCNACTKNIEIRENLENEREFYNNIK